MLERDLVRTARALHQAARVSAARFVSTSARRDPAVASAPCQGAPALSDAMLWGLTRWGRSAWGPAAFSAPATKLSGRWGQGRWGFMFYGRPRVRVR